MQLIVKTIRTKGFKDLIVWQKACTLVREIYQATRHFPSDEQYGLTRQMRRAAVAIPSNIAEGYGRQSKKEYRQFLCIAYSSLCELETQYLLAIDLSYIPPVTSIEGLLKEVGGMLYRMTHPDP